MLTGKHIEGQRRNGHLLKPKPYSINLFAGRRKLWNTWKPKQVSTNAQEGGKFMSVVTIRGRLGSGAPEVGKQVAEKLQADYVDREIIARVAAATSSGRAGSYRKRNAA